MVRNRVRIWGPGLDSRQVRLAARGVAHSWLECLCVAPLCQCLVVMLADIASNAFTVAFFHCKRWAFIRSKPHYCQAQRFQMFFVGWLIMLGRGNSLSLQELGFEYVEAALLPSTVVSEVFCGLDHHVGRR